MQLVQKDYSVTFSTRNGEFTILRKEYEAFMEVLGRKGFTIPDWDEMMTWNESRITIS